MRIGVIGTGFMSSTVVEAIAGDGHQIVVSERGSAHAKRLTKMFDNVSVASNQNVLDQSDVIILGLVDEVASDLLPSLTFRADHQVISLMVGITLAQTTALVTPAKSTTIAIPFPFIAKGGAPLLIYPESALVKGLFGARCEMFILENEGTFRAFMATQAVLSPVLKMLASTANWQGERTGNKAEAERFLQALVGRGLTARPDGEAEMFNTMLAELNTKGGLNAELREHMIAAGMDSTLTDGLDQLEARFDEE